MKKADKKKRQYTGTLFTQKSRLEQYLDVTLKSS